MKTEIPLHTADLGENGLHFYIISTFKGEEKVVIVDTAASKTVFDLDQMPPECIMETNESMNGIGIGGEVSESAVVNIEQIDLDSHSIKDFKSYAISFKMINDMYEKFIDKKVFGLIGADILFEYKAIINLGTMTIILHTDEIE